jgi:hypothetical protein
VKSPGRMLGAIGDRLRGARYVVGDALTALARVPRAVGRGTAEFWGSMAVVTRRRLVAAAGAVAVILLIAGLVVPNLPCSFPGGDACPPDDDAIELVPGDALAYVHANLDPETEQYEAVADVAARTPLVSRQILGSLLPLVIGGGGVPSDYARDVAPWAGGELALAVVGSRGREQQVQLIEVGDEEGADAYVESITAGEPRDVEYREVVVSEDQRGLASARVEGFLVLGAASGVRAVIDAATASDGAESLADDEVAGEALEELPSLRFAEAFVSPAGLELLAADRRGPLATLDPFLDSASSRGAAIALSADSEGLELATRSLLDAERADANPGFFAAFEAFEPELPGELAPDALAYVGVGNPSETAAALLGQAKAQAPGVAAGFTELVERLQRDAGVDVERDLLPALRGESAFTVVPRAEAERARGASLPGQDPPATLAPGAGATPYVELLASEVDEERARDALARLQGPVSRSVDRDLGAPVFSEEELGDVKAQVLRISPTAQLTYAIFDQKLAIASDPAGVRRAVTDDGDGLAASERYERATEDLPDEPGLLAYLDVAELLRFGERSGLAVDPAYATFAPDLRRLEAFALGVETDDDILRADARLLVQGD